MRNRCVQLWPWYACHIQGSYKSLRSHYRKSNDCKSKQKCACFLTCPAALLCRRTGLAPSRARGGLCRCWRRSRASSGSPSSCGTGLQGAALCCAHGSETSDVCQSCSCLCCCRPAATPLSAPHLQHNAMSRIHRNVMNWSTDTTPLKDCPY